MALVSHGKRRIDMRKVRMSVRLKLAISYILFLVVIFAIGLVGLYNMGRIYENGNKIYENNLRSVNLLETVNQMVRETNLCIRDALENKDKNVGIEVEQLRNETQELLTSYEQIESTDMEKRRYKQCRLSIQTFDKQLDNIIKQIQDGDVEAAEQRYYQELSLVRACTYELLDAIVDLTEKNAEVKYLDNQEMYQSIRYMVIVLVIGSMLLAAVIAFYVNQMLKNRLTSIGLLAERLSEYDISEDIENITADEFGDITEVLNNAQLMLRDLITKITEESDDMSAIGLDLSESVHRSEAQIEQINLVLYDVETEIGWIEKMCKEWITHTEGESKVGAVKTVDICTKQRERLGHIQSELSRVISYISQIGIIIEQQNEISKSHREQIGKFKI